MRIPKGEGGGRKARRVKRKGRRGRRKEEKGRKWGRAKGKS